MYVCDSCATCLYDKQAHKIKDEKYLEKVKEIIDNRGEKDSAPFLIYQFNRVYKKMYGSSNEYAEIKQRYNDLVLGFEDKIRKVIENDDFPLARAFQYSRVGNYIDFGAMNSVDEEIFMNLLSEAKMSEADRRTFDSFIKQCANAKTFLLLCDNCGEIVLDKLFLEQLKKEFPDLSVTVMVRGKEVLNDATIWDAQYVGMDRVANIIDNSYDMAGTVYEMLPEKSKEIFDSADIIMSKGQGNYESLYRDGRHIFYSFLCKCDLFVKRFDVPEFTGIFVEEGA